MKLVKAKYYIGADYVCLVSPCLRSVISKTLTIPEKQYVYAGMNLYLWMHVAAELNMTHITENKGRNTVRCAYKVYLQYDIGMHPNIMMTKPMYKHVVS